MAAISHVFTIRRAAQILGRDEDLLWELSDQLEPEDGKLWVCDIDGAETPRLHPRWHRGSSRNYQGSDRSRRLIPRRVYRGAQRMLTPVATMRRKKCLPPPPRGKTHELACQQRTLANFAKNSGSPNFVKISDCSKNKSPSFACRRL